MRHYTNVMRHHYSIDIMRWRPAMSAGAGGVVKEYRTLAGRQATVAHATSADACDTATASPRRWLVISDAAVAEACIARLQAAAALAEAAVTASTVRLGPAPHTCFRLALVEDAYPSALNASGLGRWPLAPGASVVRWHAEARVATAIVGVDARDSKGHC